MLSSRKKFQSLKVGNTAFVPQMSDNNHARKSKIQNSFVNYILYLDPATSIAVIPQPKQYVGKCYSALVLAFLIWTLSHTVDSKAAEYYWWWSHHFLLDFTQIYTHIYFHYTCNNADVASPIFSSAFPLGGNSFVGSYFFTMIASSGVK